MRDMGRAMTIGERVAWYRRRRGISQEVLAGLVGRTTDWLSKVENGRANLDRLSVITSLAAALDVAVGDLLGEPSIVQWAGTDPTRTVTALRETLMDYSSLTLALGTTEPGTDAELRSGVEGVWSAYQASQFGYVTTMLPNLISSAQSAVRQAESGEARREAQRMLALAYHAAAATLGKVGEAELSWIASDRGLAAAEASEDRKVVASLLRSVAHSMLSNGRPVAAADVASQATDHLSRGSQPDDETWWLNCSRFY